MSSNSSILPNPLLVTSRQAAKMLAISERTLWSMTAPRGQIPAVRMGPAGRAVRYHIADLERTVEEMKRGPAQ